MNLTFSSLKGLVLKSISNPREAARDLIGLNLPMDMVWQAFALTTTLLVIVLQVLLLLAGEIPPLEVAPGEFMELNFPGPFVMALTQIATQAITVIGLYLASRAAGGTGRLEDTVLLMSWHQFVLICGMIVLLILGVVIPLLAALAMIALMVGYFYVLTMFLTELHKFEQPGAVFVMIIATLFAVTFGVALIMTMVLAIAGVEPPNV